ncbi:MAG: SIS domain-containing protein [Acidobacteriales bacterium]|nr:SIS domain-containing protein [Terriglobales bacterium]
MLDNKLAQHSPRDGREGASILGAHTRTEILSQPACWRACLQEVQASGILEEISNNLKGRDEWIFVGCGSSYYLAFTAAANMSRACPGIRARAIPASELLLYPELALPRRSKVNIAVLISRSGQTSEVLEAGQMLRSRGVQTLAITCASAQPLAIQSDMAVVLSSADEQSTVMTRSFTSMLLVLQGLIATIAGDRSFFPSIPRICAVAEDLLGHLPTKICDFVQAHEFSDYVYLGQGPFYGLACEGALKITEMSVSYAQSFHTLEFRHGPKSIVAKDTLLIFFLSEHGYAAERDALEEMKSLGGTTLVIVNEADARIRAAADFVVETHLPGEEYYRLGPCLLAAQLLGLYTGIEKGLNPDSPRNLNRVVLLEQGSSVRKSSEDSEHAAL